MKGGDAAGSFFEAIEPAFLGSREEESLCDWDHRSEARWLGRDGGAFI
jgi:hypothetical protein